MGQSSQPLHIPFFLLLAQYLVCDGLYIVKMYYLLPSSASFVLNVPGLVRWFVPKVCGTLSYSSGCRKGVFSETHIQNSA